MSTEAYLIPGQVSLPNRRAGPPLVNATSSARGYLSAAAIDFALRTNKARGHASPDIEALQMFPDLPAGKVYAIPCAREEKAAYRFHKYRDGRKGWVNLAEHL